MLTALIDISQVLTDILWGTPDGLHLGPVGSPWPRAVTAGGEENAVSPSRCGARCASAGAFGRSLCRIKAKPALLPICLHAYSVTVKPQTINNTLCTLREIRRVTMILTSFIIPQIIKRLNIYHEPGLQNKISFIPNFCYVPGWRYLRSFENQSYQRVAALTLVILCIFPLSSCVFNLVSQFL